MDQYTAMWYGFVQSGYLNMTNYQRLNLHFPMVFPWFSYDYPIKITMCSPPARHNIARFAGAIVGATAEREDGAAEQTQAWTEAHQLVAFIG